MNRPRTVQSLLGTVRGCLEGGSGSKMELQAVTPLEPTGLVPMAGPGLAAAGHPQTTQGSFLAG